MREIRVKFIPHYEQRYPTVGDYWEDGGALEVRISQMADWRYGMLVLIHELIEYTAVKAAGIPLRLIDEFDIQFERERDRGLHGQFEEPGNDRGAPYHKQHVWATRVEHVCAWLFMVKWKVYEHAVNSL